MRWAAPAVLAGGLALGLLLRGKAKRSSSSAPPRLVRSMSGLSPATALAVRRTLERMHAMGWDAVVHETRRSEDRARELAAKGAGIERSMHRLGLAADIISRSRGWQAPLEFWVALRDAAEAEGLVSGARWEGDKYDPAHVQAVAVSSQDDAWNARDVDALAKAQIARRRGA